MPFDSQITQLSTDQLDQLFDATPDSTPSADTLVVGKDTSKEGMIDPSTAPIAPNSSSDIPFYNPETDDQPDVIQDAEIVDDKAEPKTKAPKKAAAPKETAPVEGAAEQADPKAVDESNINNVLKNTVDYLVSSGKWVDFEGREDLEITQDSYAELAAKQSEYSAVSTFNELVDGTGEYGKAIFNHMKNGGNPDEIIDLFKEEKQISKIDTSTEEGKQTLIEKYYKDVLGWKPEKVDRTVKRLITDNIVDEEFADVKEMYDEHYKKRLNELDVQAKATERQNEERQVKFVSSIRAALDESEDLAPKEKEQIANSILQFKHKLQNGQKVNDFYLKFAEVQSDPKEYVDLIRFIMDKKKYVESISRKKETAANLKAYNFIKGNAAVAKPKSTELHINDNPGKTRSGTDFSFALKHK